MQQLSFQQQLQQQQKQVIHKQAMSLGFPIGAIPSFGPCDSLASDQTKSSMRVNLNNQLQQQNYKARDELASSLQHVSTKNGTTNGNSQTSKDVSFPVKLHQILSNPDYEDMISWMPHGKAFRIHQSIEFERAVIPLHFRHSKYASFMRQINGWGFERTIHGNDHNSYKHDVSAIFLLRVLKSIVIPRKIATNTFAVTVVCKRQSRTVQKDEADRHCQEGERCTGQDN